MGAIEKRRIELCRLTDIRPKVQLDHMNDRRIARHLPLLRSPWHPHDVDAFIAAKETKWDDDGLGHWAILVDGEYAGWGGLQREGLDWDFGLVLRPAYFGFGAAIARFILAWVAMNTGIREISFLLPPSRSIRALARLGARRVGQAHHSGEIFSKWTLNLSEFTRRNNDRPEAAFEL